MTIEQDLSAFAHKPVRNPAALAMMRMSLFDWAACAIAGKCEPLSQILIAKAQDEGGKPEAHLIGGGKVPARAAALVNGAVSHALDFDDTHFAHIGHPSVAVIPAALALAERQKSSFASFVQAALIGVEASVRVGIWLGRDHYEQGFHQTATAGAFGAALAAARLLALDPDQTRMALGLAATRASGLKSQFGSMGKPYNAGLAAETGVEAALLAKAGLTSSLSGLTHAQGFAATHLGQFDKTALVGLGEDWMFETVSHKFHACCHGLHAMIEAVLTLNPDPDRVLAVTIRTHPRWLSVCNKPAPATGLEAKFSYRFACAMVLGGVDTADIGNFSDAMTERPNLIALRDRVRVEPDPTLSEMQSHVILVLTDGTTLQARADLDAPLAPSDRLARLQRKAQGLLGAGAAPLWRSIEGADLNGFVKALTSP